MGAVFEDIGRRLVVGHGGHTGGAAHPGQLECADFIGSDAEGEYVEAEISGAAADQFASDSGAKVGAIRRASQGLFSISDRDQAASGDTEGGGQYYPRASDPNKRVRVVVTIDYLLE